MTAPSDVFARTFAEARASFLGACAAAGGEIVSHRHPLPGPDGAPLFLDEARFGAPDARRVLFMQSGLHGVEGYCGSGIQTFLLRGGLAARLPAGVALVMVHAVNPWGFAWTRRVNEDNVDVNRNFLAPGSAPPENADYDRLYEALHPTVLDEESAAASLAAIGRFQQEAGALAAYRALSGGQYRHPRGMQYGGSGPVWSNRTLHAIWARHAARAELSVLLDLHSGLGPRGVGLLLQTAPAAAPAATLGHAWWPDLVRTEPPAGSDAALVSGLVGPAFRAALPHAAAVDATVEFGTLDLVRVMQAVQAESWLQHHGERESERGRAILRQMRDAFFVDEDDWKEKVLARAEEVVSRTLAGMQSFVPAAIDAVRIRAALPSDVDVLVEFNRAMAQETEDLGLDPEALRAGTQALLADPERGRVLVVEEAGRVVASLMLTLEWSEWRNGWFWWIQSVYVRPEARRRGHYRRLHDHVRALAAREPDVRGLRLYVERENHGAQATYRSLGMDETHYRLFEETTRR